MIAKPLREDKKECCLGILTIWQSFWRVRLEWLAETKWIASHTIQSEGQVRVKLGKFRVNSYDESYLYIVSSFCISGAYQNVAKDSVNEVQQYL